VSNRPALDGYGLPFDPERHLKFVREGNETQRNTVYVDPCGTGRIDPDLPAKELPAGWYDKTGRSGA